MSNSSFIMLILNKKKYVGVVMVKGIKDLWILKIE